MRGLAKQHLNRLSRYDFLSGDALIDGQWRSGERRAPVIDPATGEEIGNVAWCELRDVDLAIAAAERDFPLWRQAMHERWFNDRMRPSAVISLSNSATDAPAQERERKLEERFGIKRETIGGAEIRAMFPGIAPEDSRGIVLPRNGYVVSTIRLFRALAQIFREEGGRIVYEDVQKIIPSGEGNRWTVMTNAQNHIARNVVIAAGVWRADRWPRADGRLESVLDHASRNRVIEGGSTCLRRKRERFRRRAWAPIRACRTR